MTTEIKKELDAALEILKLHQQSLQAHEAYFNKIQEVMNAQARHIEVLEMKVANLQVAVFPDKEEVPSAPDTL